MRINAINQVKVNRTNMNTRKNNSARLTVQQPNTEPVNSGNVAFKGAFGAVAGGIMGVVIGGVLTLITAGATSAALVPIIIASAIIGHSEEEKSNREDQNNRK